MKTQEKLEKQSSALTLSDMEIFIFPDLFYALVYANIMSPEIWKWRDNPWFKNIENKSFSYKINRVKQYIMDHYTFNLDLETWGLTTKEKELERFSAFIDADTLSQSNALFGYEGDKYYFSIDIRKHFGLDKYTSDKIPYWKTETLEAMNAFRYKEGYGTGAGECVSFATLYAAAMFIVGRIPLEKIFLIATPLHSQNFILEKDGFLTNNRRIVTKGMWYNGTMLSAKARRAIENEKITIVSHITGHIHTAFGHSSIAPEAYQAFSDSLRSYLDAELSFETFINFLRTDDSFWDCFQYAHLQNGKKAYLELRKIFEYERGSKNTITNASRDALFSEIDMAEFHLERRDDKIVLNAFETYLQEHASASFSEKQAYFEEHILECPHCPQMSKLFERLQAFLHIDPRLPELSSKTVVREDIPHLHIDQSREEIVAEIERKRLVNEVADLAFYAARRMDLAEWPPFIKAAKERQPVAFEALSALSLSEMYAQLEAFDSESIYDEMRLALPDEVWNFRRGDGLEKALTMGCVYAQAHPQEKVVLRFSPSEVELACGGEVFRFATAKTLQGEIVLSEK